MAARPPRVDVAAHPRAGSSSQGGPPGSSGSTAVPSLHLPMNRCRMVPPTANSQSRRPVAQLAVRPDLGDAGELLDATAKAACKARLDDLQAELARAVGWTAGTAGGRPCRTGQAEHDQGRAPPITWRTDRDACPSPAERRCTAAERLPCRRPVRKEAPCMAGDPLTSG